MLRAGDPAPDFTTLPELESAASASAPGPIPVLVAFFKISCPVCQYTFPFLERLHQGAKGIRILGISQDDAESTREFNQELGITLPMRLEQRGFQVSNAFRIDHVPSMFLVSGNSIAEAETGFSKAFLERMAELAGLEEPLFLPGERIPAYRPG